MKTSFEILLENLKEKNLRLSYQRLKVLEYLFNNRCHPTVEEIYTNLHKEIPTLSKTTVYNTLNALIDAGFLKMIKIEDHETRYDFVTENHGHFKCEECGGIYDFDINVNLLQPEDLEGFKIHSKDIYFKGVCSKCIQEDQIK